MSAPASSLLALFFTFVVATIPGESIERALLGDGQADGRSACSSLWRVGSWLRTVRLPDQREALCVTYGLFEAPETPARACGAIWSRATSAWWWPSRPTS